MSPVLGSVDLDNKCIVLNYYPSVRLGCCRQQIIKLGWNWDFSKSICNSKACLFQACFLKYEFRSVSLSVLLWAFQILMAGQKRAIGRYEKSNSAHEFFWSFVNRHNPQTLRTEILLNEIRWEEQSWEPSPDLLWNMHDRGINNCFSLNQKSWQLKWTLFQI